LDVAKAEEAGKRISLISMGASGALAVIKLVVGLLAGSAAVVADGVDANGDLHASADYRRHMAIVYTARALTKALARAS